MPQIMGIYCPKVDCQNCQIERIQPSTLKPFHVPSAFAQSVLSLVRFQSHCLSEQSVVYRMLTAIFLEP